MKIPDLNVLLYAANTQSAHHATAKSWFEACYNANDPIGYTWVVLLGFIRLSTRRAIMDVPLNVSDCLATIDILINHNAARIAEPGPRHMGILGRLLLSAGAAGNLTTDAHLAAIAIEHGGELVTFDRDFERFAGLRLNLLR